MSDVKPLGTTGTVVEVADGYARNYLLPRGLAAEASKGSLALLEQQRRAKARRDAEAVANAEALGKQLEGLALTVPVKAGGNGRLFGAVTNAQRRRCDPRRTSALRSIVIRSTFRKISNLSAAIPVEIRLAKNIVAKTTVKVVAATN